MYAGAGATFFGMPVSAEAGRTGTALLWFPAGVDGLLWAALQGNARAEGAVLAR